VGVLADVAGEAAAIATLPSELMRRAEADVVVLGYLARDAAPTGALPWELARAECFRHCVVIFFPILVTLESKSP
jgi:hypothetical protein